MGTLVTFICQDDPKKMSSMNLQLQSLPFPMPLDEFSALSIGQLQQMDQMAGVQLDVHEEKFMRLPGKRMSFEAPMGPLLLKVYQAWTVAGTAKEPIAYIATFSSPPDLHNSFLGDIKAIFNNFELFEPLPPIKRPIELLCLSHYENYAHLYRIKYPMNWKSKTQSEGSLFTAEFEAIMSAQETKAMELRLDVVVIPLRDRTWSLEKYTQVTLNRLKDITEDGQPPAKTEVTLGGQPAIQVAYCSSSTKKGARFIQVFTLRDSKVYTVTCNVVSVEGDIRPSFIFDAIFNSFEFLQEGFTSTSALKTFQQLQHKVGFTFDPEEWRISQGPGSVVTFERGGSEEMPFSANINLVLGPAASDSEAFHSLMKSQIELAVENVKIISEDSKTLAGITGKMLQYTGSISDKQFRFNQYFVIQGTTSYIVTVAIVAEEYDSLVQSATTLVDSFALTQ
eukprot:TRINITY_DN472_c0_g1_i1.p1 TRINITY_DN472_c0_g1~~TRINITY_DN472_c0_g1_i1.p1  ORF type:complete len:506 (-),score=85.13 TRINITY_DN472_c0_g1_i1:110-1462(-)